MTINLADNDPRVSYSVAAGATQSTFTVTFEFFVDADLNVYVDGTLKSLTTDYTVTGGAGSTGSIAMSVTGASGGSTVVVTRSIDLERTTDFPSSGPFDIASLNEELDKFISIAGDLKDKSDRALQLTDFDAAVSLTLPDVNSRKGTVLAFDSSTGAVVAGPNTSSVNTLASIATDVATLADIEDGTVATDAISDLAAIASNVTTSAGISANITTVAGISSDVTVVAGDATDIGTVATNIASVNTVATNIADVVTVANDLNEAISEIETAANDLNEATSEIDTVATNIANVNAVGLIDSDVTTVAGISANVTTVAGISANTTTVASISSDVSAVAGISANTTTVAGISSDVTTVAGMSSNVATVAGDSADIATIAGISSNVSAVGAVASDITTVANNLTNINSFADTYFVGATAPSSPTTGDLWFDTANNIMKVYDGSGFVNAGSSVNGTSNRATYTATAGQTTFAAIYDAGFVDVYLNGVKLIAGTDFTATSGSNIVLASGAAVNDTVDIVAYGTFNVANINMVNDTTPQLGGDLETNGNNITFGDNDKAQFGAGNDLQIYHDGTNSIIAEASVGGFLKIQGSDLYLTDDDGTNMLYAANNGGVTLYNGGGAKIATTSTGVSVTGTVAATSFTGDGSNLTNLPSGGSSYLAVNSSGTASSATGTEAIAIGAGATAKINDSIAIGRNAGQNQNAGYSGVSIGLESYVGSYQGVAIGEYARADGYGVAIGSYSDANNNHSVAVGNNAQATQNNSTALGRQASAQSANQFVLGNSSVSDLRCQDTSITAVSDRRDKTQIEPLSVGLDFVNAVEPKAYYKNNRNEYYDADNNFNQSDYEAATKKYTKREFGFVAQDVAAQIPNTYSDARLSFIETDDVQGFEVQQFTMGDMTPILWKALREMSDKYDALLARVSALEEN